MQDRAPRLPTKERRLIKKRESVFESAHRRAVSFACAQKVNEEDEIFNLRPLKKIESVDGRTILYEPSSTKDIER